MMPSCQQFISRCTGKFKNIFPRDFDPNRIRNAFDVFRFKFIHPVLKDVLPNYDTVYACKNVARISAMPRSFMNSPAASTKALASAGLLLMTILSLKFFVGHNKV